MRKKDEAQSKISNKLFIPVILLILYCNEFRGINYGNARKGDVG